MKYKSIFKMTMVLSILVITLAGVSCSKKENPTMDLATAISHATTQATNITVKSYTSGGEVSLNWNDAEFSTIVGYFAEYTLDVTQPRHQETGGKTTEITIPYARNYTVTFWVSEGYNLTFDYGGNTFWFTTKDMIYSGIVDKNLDEVLKQSLTKK
jgi:hypothetical protein